MADRVSIDVHDGIADVRLSRPDKLNALDAAMFTALVTAGEELAGRRDLRAVVLSGEGRSFCAGLDFSVFRSMADEGGTARARDGDGAQGDGRASRSSDTTMTTGQRAAWVWQELPVPVIAAVHGHCLGGGLQIALGADLRIVAPDARLSVLEVRWGLTPDMTGTQVLPRLVGLDVAKELTFTGREVTGEEAVALGLATRTSPAPRDDALAVAADIAARSPDAVRGAKRLLNLADRVPLADGLAAEATTIGSLIGSRNQVEAVTAFFEERRPVFEDPAG